MKGGSPDSLTFQNMYGLTDFVWPLLLHLYTTNMFSSWSDMVLNVTGTLKIDTISIEEVCEQR